VLLVNHVPLRSGDRGKGAVALDARVPDADLLAEVLEEAGQVRERLGKRQEKAVPPHVRQVFLGALAAQPVKDAVGRRERDRLRNPALHIHLLVERTVLLLLPLLRLGVRVCRRQNSAPKWRLCDRADRCRHRGHVRRAGAHGVAVAARRNVVRQRPLGRKFLAADGAEARGTTAGARRGLLARGLSAQRKVVRRQRRHARDFALQVDPVKVGAVVGVARVAAHQHDAAGHARHRRAGRRRQGHGGQRSAGGPLARRPAGARLPRPPRACAQCCRPPSVAQSGAGVRSVWPTRPKTCVCMTRTFQLPSDSAQSARGAIGAPPRGAR
jgi:hypothetical protein